MIYYSTDFTAAYGGLKAHEVTALDRRLCDIAQLVCPNSQRNAEYLIDRAGCDPEKLLVLPNATRSENVRETFTDIPDSLPSDISELERPIAGIIGNLADNLDWELLRDAIQKSPSVSWVFVGPTSMRIDDGIQSRAREQVMARRDRVRFVGPKPYGALRHYARAIDVAVLPYRKREPTYSGSSTRFYEHLAACRPMLATDGVEELTHKLEFLRLVKGPDDLAAEILRVHEAGSRDGKEKRRWLASHNETWEARAQSMAEAFLASRAGSVRRPELRTSR